MMNNALLFIVGIASSACAQIFTRQGMQHHSGDIFGSLFSWQIVLALCCYALAFVSYALFLARVELSLAAPLFVGSIVVLMQVYGYIAGEQIDQARILGSLFILAGLVFLARSLAQSSGQ